MTLESIRTERLELVPATIEMTRAAIEDRAALAALLSAAIPSGWPPQYLDRQALEFTIARLQEGSQNPGWWMHFVVRRERGAEPATLVGSGGYAGPPTADGTVEVGYGIVAEHQRRGYATETVHGLVAHAFSRPEVERVIAETLPELAPSIGVLEKCGFAPVDERSEPGVVRFALTRAAWRQR